MAAAWLVGGSPVFRCRIYGKDWNGVYSTGMRDPDGALEVEAFAERLHNRRRWDILDAIRAKEITLADAFDADRRGQLDDVLRTINDVDLDPLVDEWAKNANAKYVTQVRCLIPERFRFPRSSFTKAVVSRFLATLDVSGPTKNRYRAALSVFARWLVEREILEHNPVRDVRGYKEHDPRDHWMTWESAQDVAGRAPEPYRTLFLLMAGTGIEWSAAARLRVTDIDLQAQAIHARGSKTRWRNRVVRAQPWAWDALEKHVEQAKWYRDPLHPERLAELNELFDQPARIQREACEAAGRFIPMVQENVCGAQPWVGRAQWRYGSYYLWGDVPALMPNTLPQQVQNKCGHLNWDQFGQPGYKGDQLQEKAIKDRGARAPKNDGVKVGGLDWSKRIPGQAFNTHAERQTKDDGVKQGGGWFHDATEHTLRRHSSKSKARKAASARIAKIPLPLAQWIAHCYHPARLVGDVA